MNTGANKSDNLNGYSVVKRINRLGMRYPSIYWVAVFFWHFLIWNSGRQALPLHPSGGFVHFKGKYRWAQSGGALDGDCVGI